MAKAARFEKPTLIINMNDSQKQVAFFAKYEEVSSLTCCLDTPTMQSRQFSGLVKSPVVGRLSTLDYLLRSSLDFSSMSLPNVFLTLFSECVNLTLFSEL